MFGGPGVAPRRAAGVMDFGQCDPGHYLFDLVVVLRTLRARWRRAGYSPELSDERVQEALLAGYESARGLPPDYGGLFGTLDVMQRMAAVNWTLELRASPAAAHGARGEKFLRQSVVWLGRSHSR
jgi:Ser/Thr protein kinase RdoA (MazF antagonist)